MTIETTVLEFKLSNTYDVYQTFMNSSEQKVIFKDMGVKTFYIRKSFDNQTK